MAKKKSFDPDALAKAGQEIVKKHQVRENVTPQPAPTPKPAPKKRGPKSDEKTQLCRIGISYHRRVKFAATRKDMTIRQYLEELIGKNVPDM
jgi:hypothetical protein